MANINKVLVTGAAGNVGGAVVNALQEKGIAVVGGTTRPETARLPEGVPMVEADYTDPATMATATTTNNTRSIAGSESAGPVGFGG